MKKKLLLILGQEGTAAELKEYTAQHDSKFDEIKKEAAFGDVDFLDHIRDLSISYDIYYIFGFVYNEYRDACLKCLDQIEAKPYTFVHPEAFVAESATISNGCYIGPNATIAPFAVLEPFVMVNINASVGHHSILRQHVSVLPGARISGKVEIGARSLVGSNSVLYQGIIIGEDNLIDAMTYIKRDLPPGQISYGVKSNSIKRV